MPNRIIRNTSSLYRQFAWALEPSGKPGWSTRSDTVVGELTEGPKVVGQYIVYSDGSKFRRATSWHKSSLQLRGTTPQKVVAVGQGYPYSGYPQLIDSSPGGYRMDDIWTYAPNALEWAGVPNIRQAPSPSASQRNEAVTKALLQLADNKANIGENLATFRQTINLMGNPLNKLVSELRRGHKISEFKPFLRQVPRRGVSLEGVAQRYLEYVYGLRPLMQDLFGLSELAKRQGNSPLFVSAYGKSRRQLRSSGYNFHNTSSNCDSTLLSGMSNSVTRCSLWGRVDPNYSGTRALNQLGLLNPASLAWELVPWSFVVDWVLPIGSVLQALTAPAGLIFVDGSLSHRVSVSSSWQHEYNIPGWFDVKSSQPATFSCQGEYYRRTVLSSWPQAGLWIDMDPLRSDRSWKALALSVSSLRSLR